MKLSGLVKSEQLTASNCSRLKSKVLTMDGHVHSYIMWLPPTFSNFSIYHPCLFSLTWATPVFLFWKAVKPQGFHILPGLVSILHSLGSKSPSTLTGLISILLTPDSVNHQRLISPGTVMQPVSLQLDWGLVVTCLVVSVGCWLGHIFPVGKPGLFHLVAAGVQMWK